MTPEKLVAMANQIASYFRSYDEDEACAGIQDHIVSFWTPTMRRTLLMDGMPAGLHPLVARALREVPRAESPVLKETGGPDEVGLLGSDAG